jgi:LysM repeat protein
MRRYLLLSILFLLLSKEFIANACSDEQTMIDSPYFSIAYDTVALQKLDSLRNNDVFGLWDEKKIDPYKNINLAKKTDTTLLLLVNDTSKYVHPVKNKINSPFGQRGYRYHYGMDIELVTGDSVLCAFDGIVRMAKYYSGFGNLVLVSHYNGLETLYAHLSKIKVEVGEKVKAGHLLGLGGATGRATGSHLHFEVRFMGKAMDPRQIIDFASYSLISDSLQLSCHTYEYLIERSKTKYHYVRSGDSLWRISKRYGVSINRLCALNGISRNTILQIGRPIRYQ